MFFFKAERLKWEGNLYTLILCTDWLRWSRVKKQTKQKNEGRSSCRGIVIHSSQRGGQQLYTDNRNSRVGEIQRRCRESRMMVRCKMTMLPWIGIHDYHRQFTEGDIGTSRIIQVLYNMQMTKLHARSGCSFSCLKETRPFFFVVCKHFKGNLRLTAGNIKLNCLWNIG